MGEGWHPDSIAHSPRLGGGDGRCAPGGTLPVHCLQWHRAKGIHERPAYKKKGLEKERGMGESWKERERQRGGKSQRQK